MTPGINTLLLSTGALGSFTCSGMTLPIYMGPTALRGIRATGDTLSNVESQVFTPYKFGSTAGDRTPDLLTTRPTCYHSATALCMKEAFLVSQTLISNWLQLPHYQLLWLAILPPHPHLYHLLGVQSSVTCRWFTIVLILSGLLPC